MKQQMQVIRYDEEKTTGEELEETLNQLNSTGFACFTWDTNRKVSLICGGDFNATDPGEAAMRLLMTGCRNNARDGEGWILPTFVLNLDEKFPEEFDMRK